MKINLKSLKSSVVANVVLRFEDKLNYVFDVRVTYNATTKKFVSIKPVNGVLLPAEKLTIKKHVQGMFA